MKKNKLLFIPFLSGLAFLVFSWYLSFPLSISSSNDLIYSQVSIFYWFALPLLLTSMYLMAISFKNKYWKWIMSVSCVITLYSLWYFYFTLPTSDAVFMRGLTENFISTNSLNISQFNLTYYQWPSFFILADIVTSVSGLSLINYEFLLFIILGFLLSSGLYVYASKLYNRSGFLAVIVFFILMFSFLNFQAVPFTLAFGLLFLLFILDTQKMSNSVIIAMIILYSSITITHVYVPLFYVLYLLIRSVISKGGRYFRFLILTLTIYLLVQITWGKFTFATNILQVFILPSEYTSIVTMTFVPVTIQIDVIAQFLSRIVTVVFAFLCFAGFLFLIFKRKLRQIDKAIFISGIIYLGMGVVLFTLGLRALPLVVAPISLGIVCLYESKFKPYLHYLVLILLILAVFIPFHSSFNDFPITFQTKEDLMAANFMIENYNWTSNSIIISDSSAKWYISPQIQSYPQIDTQFDSRFGLSNITNYDSIFYSIGLEKSLQLGKISVAETSNRIFNKFSVFYDSGLSYIAGKSK